MTFWTENKSDLNSWLSKNVNLDLALKFKIPINLPL